MASFWTNTGLTQVLNGGVKIYSDTIKVMLCGSGLVPAKADTAVNMSTSTDAATNEITATNYARGYGGAGRKTLAPTIAVDNTNNGVKVTFPNPTWTALGGATNATVAWAAIIKEGASNDTTSVVLAYLDPADTPTNGGDFTLTFDATNGELYIRA